MHIGFIGVGNMGGPIALNLVKAGKDVLVYKRSKRRLEKTPCEERLFQITHNVQELAVCDIVFTCLPLPEDVKTIMCGTDGLLAKMNPGATYVDMSTIDPETSHRLEEMALQHGIGFLQCTLGKTPAHAACAEEPLFIGGSRQCFDLLQSLWPIIGSPAHYMGTIDAACAIKLVSNMIGMSNLVILSEGLHLLHQTGMDLNAAIELLKDTGAWSFQMDIRGPRMVEKNYKNCFGLDLALKDVRLGCEMAETWGMDIPTMKSVLDMFKKASAAGYGDKDCCGVHEVVS